MMTSKTNRYPTEEELKNRILRQLSWRKTDAVALIWHGYLNGLLEWGVIEVHLYDKLMRLLPRVGSKELYEQALDEPITPEAEIEVERYLRLQDRNDGGDKFEE